MADAGFSGVYFWHLSKKSGGSRFMGFCLGPQLSSPDLRICFCDSTMLVFCLFVYYDSVVDLESEW